ncbi:MAG: choice-of-anchor D domain-containing protein [Solirubrobacteraceae bacterium]|nr:choice-of-anchor D domain-containing protein [Solirubrobacteraceae bacterium]
MTPADGVSGIPRDRAVTAEVVLPNVGGGIDTATLTADTVSLTRVSDGVKVDAHLNTSGGGDVIVLQPRALLDPTTQYRFSVTDGLRDVTGARFIPRTTVFTTGVNATTSNTSVRFAKAPQSAGSGQLMASVSVGPDHRLYATTLDGKIMRFPIGATGTLGTPTTITTVADHEGGPRHIIGLAFDPAATAANPILWVSHSDAAYTNGPNWAGKISRLSGADLGTITDYVVGLPRSVRDHETNSLAFGPDGALYVNQGSLSAMGAPDNAWGDRPEELLSAAVLRLNTSAVTSPPLQAKTAEGGTYDPFAANAPLTIYASGVRNAYDLVWHDNGQLYVPVNGSAAGGSIPATPATLPARCAQRLDFAANGPWTGPAVPGATAVPVQPDLLLSIKKGRYYGHPNPSRCEYASFGANPTAGVDPFESVKYPVGTQPDRNWDRPAFDFGAHFSPNGVVEFRGTQWGGALDKALIVVRYSAGDDLVALPVAPSDGHITGQLEAIPGLSGFTDPLDITQDPQTGNLYVTELGAARITLLRPDETGTPAFTVAPTLHVEDATVGQTAMSEAVTVSSTGSSALSVMGLSITGPDAGDFDVTPDTSLPLTVAVGETSPLRVSFSPTTTGIKTATLSITTNAGVKTVDLRGLATTGTGGTLEPSLKRILETYRIAVDVGDADPASSVLPVNSRIGDEVPAQRFRKAGTDPVRLQPIAAFGPNGPSGRLGRIGMVPAAGPGSRTDLLTIPNTSSQDLAPDVSGTPAFDPGSGQFGLFASFEYFDTRTAYTEDALNTMATGGVASHQARTFQLRTESGTPVPNAYVVAFEDIPIGPSSDFNDVVMIVRGVEPVDIGTARLKAQSLDAAAFPDRLTFSRIGAVPTQYPNVHQHDEAVVRIQNPSAASAQVTGLTTTGPFTVVAAPATPATIAPGGSIDVRVRFTATSGRTASGKLEVATTATATPVVGIDLAGYRQNIPEGGVEPTLSEIVRTVLGYGTTIVGAGQSINGKGAESPVGDEVLAPYWKRVDPTQPARMTQLAAYHGQNSSESIRFAMRGAEKSAARAIGTHDYLDAQTILPHAAGSSTAPLVRTFAPPAAFALNIAAEWSDPAMNDQSADLANGCSAPCGQHVRAWPVKDRIGRTIAGSYFVAMDYSGINYDYNDNVYLLENVEPDDDRPVLLRYDAGTSTSYTDGQGRIWASDSGLFSPSFAPNEGNPNDPIAGTSDDRLYATYRGNVGPVSQAQRVLSYTIPVSGASRVDVRLLLAERFNNGPGQRVFDVFAENLLRIDDLDIFARAGGRNIAWSEEIRDVDVSDGVLTLRLAASADYPSLAGIEVRCSAGCDAGPT